MGLKRFYFREILPGDILKFLEESNITKSGGGARDLRIRPASVYAELLLEMFPNLGNLPGNQRGQVKWRRGKKTESVEIILWRPTAARPGELRIPKISRISAWEIDPSSYHADKDENLAWFYLLAQDQEGVWALILRERFLEMQDPVVRKFVKERIKAKKGGRAIAGGMDIVKNKVYAP